MRKVIALVRASWLEAASYRMRSALSLFGLILAAVPFYFVARGLQSTVGQSIQHEGGDYFGFLVIGMVSYAVMRVSLATLPNEIGAAIGNGTFEALLGTPTRMPTLMAGLVGYNFAWTFVRLVVFMAFAGFMGAHILWARSLFGVLVMLLIVMAYLPFALIGAALIIAFRSAGALQNGVSWVSALLGGVYYPTQVVPSYLLPISGFVPLTYGLRALRRIMLEPNTTLAEVAPDIARTFVIGAILLGISLVALVAALRYARRAGTLAQY